MTLRDNRSYFIEGFELNISEFLMYHLSKEQIKDFLRAYDLKISGNKDEIIERLISHNEFDIEEIPAFLYKEELQEICDILELPRTGNKDDLWERIIDEVGELELLPIIDRTSVAIPEEIEEYIPVNIKELRHPETVSATSTNFQIDLIIQNEGKTDEVVQVWHYAIWDEGGRKKEPPVKLEAGDEYCEEIFLQTPKKEDKFSLIIKLLDSGGILIKDQKLKLDLEVKTEGRDKILKWGKSIGKFLLTRRIN